MSTELLALQAMTTPMRSPSFMRPSGNPASVEALLGWWLTIIACAVVAIVAALLLVGVFRKRVDTNNEPERREPQVAVRWIYVGVGITVVILLGAFGGMMATLAYASHPPQPTTLTLEITGHEWWWEVRYTDSLASDGFVTANEIHLPVGRPVRLRLHSADVIHSFWIPELAGKTDLIPGQTNESWIEATRAGEYRGQCAEYCGLEHAKMAAMVFADTPEQWSRWAAGQRSSAETPAGGAALAGHEIFVRSCSACHAVRGTDGEGRVGPDLTHLASRTTIAAGVLPNTTDGLEQWLADPQEIKPGSMMPAIAMTAGDRSAVIAYLRSLK